MQMLWFCFDECFSACPLSYRPQSTDPHCRHIQLSLPEHSAHFHSLEIATGELVAEGVVVAAAAVPDVAAEVLAGAPQTASFKLFTESLRRTTLSPM